jgi:lipopolysaccharide transport system permease protein
VVVLNALINFGIIFVLFTAFLIVTGSFPGLVYLALIPLIGLIMMFAVGLGILLGVLNVFFRDVGQFFGILITFWFWLTPIVYPITILPETGRALMAYNPMALMIEAVQGVLVQGVWPVWQSLLYPLVLAMIFCVLGWRLFRSRSGELVDEL